MIPVLLYGQENDLQITNTLLGAIRGARKSALHITRRAVALIPPGVCDPDFIILDNDDIPYLQLNQGIVIFKPGFPGEKSACRIPGEFFAIVDPANAGAMELLEKNEMKTITCGLSQKDTVTFSSIGTENAVVSLQRRLTALSGKIVEPLEFPMEFGAGHTQYSLLAAAAVLCLAEYVTSKTKFVIR